MPRRPSRLSDQLAALRSPSLFDLWLMLAGTAAAIASSFVSGIAGVALVVAAVVLTASAFVVEALRWRKLFASFSDASDELESGRSPR